MLLAVRAFAAGEEPDRHRFAIDEGALTKAIQQFSQQADVQIITTLDTGHTKVGRLEGVMTTKEALARLLSGLPIEAEYVAGGYILKSKALSPQPEVADPIAAEEVVVTGYRNSLLKAIDLKHVAVGSTDSILADDIAAFPDPNLAEFMQRIAGVAITRDSGEGRQITVRSLSGDFSRTQINGMEVLSNTASGMDDRACKPLASFDFSLFASELFDRVTVEKSYAAEQDEGGIAGTVELHSPRPFDL